VEREKLITKTDIANQIETKHQEVHTKEDKIVPICHSSEKLVEVPQLMEKVVERIVVMPQVHEVTKHIIDLTGEETPEEVKQSHITRDGQSIRDEAFYLVLLDRMEKELRNAQ